MASKKSRIEWAAVFWSLLVGGSVYFLSGVVVQSFGSEPYLTLALARYSATGFAAFAGYKWPEVSTRLLLGGLLFYAGFNKMLDVSKFATHISHFRLLPGVLDRFFAVVLPWNEAVVGTLLIFGIWTRAAALLSMLFFAVFAVAVSSAIARNLNIDCGCLGNADASKVGLITLAKDAVGMILAIYTFMNSGVLPKK